MFSLDNYSIGYTYCIFLVYYRKRSTNYFLYVCHKFQFTFFAIFPKIQIV